MRHPTAGRMLCCIVRGCREDNDVTLTCPPECLQGETVPLELHVPLKGRHRLDWIGVFPAGVPTMPGFSHGRWIYLGAHYARSEAGGENEQIRLTIPTGKLPQHDGSFEVRFHRRNGYGRPEAFAPLKILRFRISWFVSVFLLAHK